MSATAPSAHALIVECYCTRECIVQVKSAYREEYEWCAPGHLLLSRILEDLYRRGIFEIHLGLDADHTHRWVPPALRSALDAIRFRRRNNP